MQLSIILLVLYLSICVLDDTLFLLLFIIKLKWILFLSLDIHFYKSNLLAWLLSHKYELLY